MAYTGDLIRCTVKFNLAKDGKVPIVFSLNGRQIFQKDEISMNYSQNDEFLYPYISMEHPGVRVLAKVSVITTFWFGFCLRGNNKGRYCICDLTFLCEQFNQPINVLCFGTLYLYQIGITKI